MDLSVAIEASTAVSVRSCLEQFAVCVSKLKGTQNAHIKNRHADFRLWVDSVGAIAQDRASLDWRFCDRPDDIFFIRGLLEMLEWYLKECVAFAGREETVEAVEGLKGHGASSRRTETVVDAVEDVLSKIDSMVHNLILIGTTIRRSGRKSRLQKADASFARNKERYHDLRAHLACLIVSEPSQGERTLSDTDYFATLKLSPVQNRLIEANLRRRHRFMDAQRHSHLLKGSDSAVANRLPTQPLHDVVSAMIGTKGSTEELQKPAVHVSVKSKREASDSGTKTHTMTTPGTIASAPETGFQGLQHGGHARSSVTRITAITAAAHYPRVKISNIEQFSFKCPCCCQAIPTKEAEDSQYRKHLANDVCPYTCILDDCPTPYKLFVTEKEWNEHFMNTHPPKFQCPYCESPTMNSLAGIMRHIQIQHPKMPDAELADALAKSAVHVMGLTKCPLCDSEDSPDSPELIEHILEHVHNFSLRSLPWPKDPAPNLMKVVGTFNLNVKSDTIQWVNNLIPSEGAPPPEKHHPQLSKYDKSLGEMEEDNTPRQSKLDYFAQNDYFEDESSDGRFLSKSGQSYMSGSESRQTAASFASKDTISLPELREVDPFTSGLEASWSYDPDLDGPSPTWIKRKPRVNAHWSVAIQTLDGHSSSVLSVAFSPDSKQVVSGSVDCTVRLWDAVTGVVLQALNGHSRTVTSAAFSPNSKQVVSGSIDRTVRLWDAVTGAALHTLVGHFSTVNSVAFSPDGRQVVSGSSDWTVRLWDAVIGVTLRTLESHYGTINSVTFSPDGRQVVSGSSDQTVRLCDAITGAVLQTLGGHYGTVNSLAFSPDGRQVVSSSSDQTIRLWDAVTGAVLQTLDGHSRPVTSVAFSPDSKQVVSGSMDCTVRLWDAVTGAVLQSLDDHSSPVNSVAFSPDGRQVVSGSSDWTVRLWDAATIEHPQTLTSMNKLAILRKSQGRFDEAESIYRQMLQLREKVLGLEHPDTLMNMNNLADLLEIQGRYEEAESIYRQTLQLREKVLGLEHPDTLMSMANLASTFGNQGRWDEAEKLQVQVMETRKTKLGVDHPDTLTSMADLALTLKYQGQWDEAEKLQVQVMETRKTKLGVDHPDTLTSMANLALTFENQRRWDEAEKLQVQVMETRKTKLGVDHPDTLTSMANLALTFGNQRRWDEAEKLQVQVMETRKTKLGVDHPDTLNIMNNLAFTWKGNGKETEAVRLMEECVQSRIRVLGRNHPNSVSSSTALATWKAEQEDVGLSIPIYKSKEVKYNLVL